MSTGPVVLGGHIEVPSAGLALEVPDGWYAFDLKHPELVAAMEAFNETTRSLVENKWLDWVPRGLTLIAGTLYEDLDVEAPQECTLRALSVPDGGNTSLE